MKQPFLLSAQARSLSVVEVARMSDDAAYAAFKAVRFADNKGEPFCPHCGIDAIYEFKARRIFKCKGCEKQFSLTSGTIFANRKLAYRDILTAIALFANGVNGHSALRLGRDLNVSYKTAFVLLHKLREVMAAMQASARPLSGDIEIDGVWVGGHVRKMNLKADQRALLNAARKARRDTAEAKSRSPEDGDMPFDKDPNKRFCIVTFRERRRGGRSRSLALKREHEAAPLKVIDRLVNPQAKLITDGATHWKYLAAYFDTEVVKHSIGFMDMNTGGHINGVEGFHSRLRRGERGVYVHVAGPHLQAYADEFSWRDDHRRSANGQAYNSILGSAARMSKSTKWSGYWQRWKAKKPPAASVPLAGSPTT